MNCGTLPMPSAVFAPTTVQQSMLLGDVVVGLKEMAIDHLLQRISGRLGELGALRAEKVLGAMERRLGSVAMGRVVARLAARNLAQAAEYAKTWGPNTLGFLIGSPLGPSISNVRNDADRTIVPSALDVATKAADAVKAYLNSPVVNEVPADPDRPFFQ